MRKVERPRLTLKIVYYALFDVAGMLLFASGLMWLLREESLFSRSFPASTAEAAVATVGGIALMLWAAARILRELIRQPAPGSRPPDPS